MADVLLRKLQNISGYPTLIDYPVCHVYERIPSEQERAPTHGKYQGTDQIHYFPKVLMSGQLPFPGDQIVVSGSYVSGTDSIYNILQVRQNQPHGFHITYGVDLRVYFNLKDTVSLNRPSWTVDYLGDQIPTPNFLFSGMAAAVQLISQDNVALGASVGLNRQFRVTLSQQVDFNDGDVILWVNKNDRPLQYVQQINPDRQDELPVILCNETN